MTENSELYRGKSTETGEWVQGYLFRIWEQAYILWGTVNDVPDMTEIDPQTVCKCTGLPDKNGKEIFENDICDRKEEFPEIVTYHDGDWTLDYSYASGKESGYNYCNLGFYVINRGGVEVIGNIFDNPELVKGE